MPAYSRDWAEAAARETLARRRRAPSGAGRARRIPAGDVLLFRWRAGLVAKHAAILTARRDR